MANMVYCSWKSRQSIAGDSVKGGAQFSWRLLTGLFLIGMITGLLVAASACRARQGAGLSSEYPGANPSLSKSDPSELTEDQVKAFSLLVSHCKACHAVGEYRFLQPQDARATWSQLFTQKNSKSEFLWAEQIVKSLSWPDGVPPSASAGYTPEFRYMPIGIQRNKLHKAKVGDKPARDFLIQVLRAGLGGSSSTDGSSDEGVD